MIVTCKHFDTFLDDYLAGRLSPFTRLQFRAHLVLCPQCRKYLDQYRRAILAAQDQTNIDEPAIPIPDELIETISKLMAHEESDVPGKPNGKGVD